MGGRIVLLGPPGSGKGTQAVVLAEHLRVPHVNVGEMFREAIRSQSPVGMSAKAYLDKGELVPDPVVVRLVGETLAQPRYQGGFVLDGFPRTLRQATELENLLQPDEHQIQHAISLEVSVDRILERLTLRRVCGGCGAVYHEKYSPPKEAGKCDQCGGVLSSREDDRPDVVERRIAVYEREFHPILDFYKKRNILRQVDGNQNPERVTQDILRRVGGG